MCDIQMAQTECQLKDCAGLSGIENKYKEGWEKVVTCRSCHLDQTKNAQWYIVYEQKFCNKTYKKTKLFRKETAYMAEANANGY